MACRAYVTSQQGLCLPEVFPDPDYGKTHISDNCFQLIQQKLKENALVLRRMSKENELLGKAAMSKKQHLDQGHF